MLKRFLLFSFLIYVSTGAIAQKRKINPLAKKQYDLGNNLLIKAKYKESIPQFQKALQIDSNFIECHMAIGIAYTKLRQPQVANAYFSKVLHLIPDDHEAYLYRAQNYLGLHDTTAAINDMNSAIRSRPSYATAYYSRSLIFLEKNQSTEALADMNHAIFYEKNNAAYHFQRGLIYESIGHYRDAMHDYDTVIMIEPGIYEMNAFNKRASCRRYFKDIKGAIADYTTILKKYPGNTIALINRGFAHLTNKNGEAACEDFKMAHLLGNPSAAGFLEKHCKGFFEKK